LKYRQPLLFHDPSIGGSLCSISSPSTRRQSYTWSWQKESMKKVKADRYQKQRLPEPEAIDFSAPAITSRPSDEATPLVKKEIQNARPNELTSERSNSQTEERTGEQPDRQTTGKSDDRPDVRSTSTDKSRNSYSISVPQERVKVRHSFDVFEDQKLALDHLQMAIRDNGAPKPNLGRLVQEALDAYVKKRTTGLPNVHWLGPPDERSNGGNNGE
jgi:hypothetical protein